MCIVTGTGVIKDGVGMGMYTFGHAFCRGVAISTSEEVVKRSCR